jgi:hypothetical protein
MSIGLSASLLMAATLVAALTPAGAEEGETTSEQYQLSCPNGDIASRFHMDPKTTEAPTAATIDEALEGVLGVRAAAEIHSRLRVLSDSERSVVYGFTSDSGDLIYMAYFLRHEGGYLTSGIAQCESFVDLVDDLLTVGA